MKKKRLQITVALAFAAVFSAQAQEVSDARVKEYAACQAWSYAVIKSSDRSEIPQDWAAWSFGLIGMGMASPFNDDWSPFREDARYQEQLRKIRESFGTAAPSARNPAYVAAYETCMNWVRSVKAELDEKVRKSRE